MPITIDVSAAVNGRAGLGRYAASLSQAVDALKPGHIRLFANQTRQAQTLPGLSRLPLDTIRIGYKPWRMAIWLAQVAGIGFNRLVPDAELFHATEHLLMPLHRTPTVLTVHDLIYHLFPAHHKRLNHWYLNQAMPLYVRRASHIITVSENTRRDLMRLYGTPAEKISVVYEAPSPNFAPQSEEQIKAVGQQYQLPERYLVTLGTIEPRKNLPRLVEALAALRRDDPDLRLVVIGARGWLYEGFFSAIEAFGQADAVVLPGFVPDEDLPALLGGALAAVQPSLYEGFGLPVLEAMACGTPVACSATSSLGEIADEAALTFDPAEVDDLIAALRQLIDDGGLRDSLREKGWSHAARFSWARAAAETWAAYEGMLGS
jgi:glycosyltransferase involved in cell wall biosynthesis